jgi:hypothetical protein
MLDKFLRQWAAGLKTEAPGWGISQKLVISGGFESIERLS